MLHTIQDLTMGLCFVLKSYIKKKKNNNFDKCFGVDMDWTKPHQ